MINSGNLQANERAQAGAVEITQVAQVNDDSSPMREQSVYEISYFFRIFAHQPAMKLDGCDFVRGEFAG